MKVRNVNEPNQDGRALLLCLFVLVLTTLASPAAAATFTVNSLGDFSDDDPNDNICETVRGNIIDGFRLECSLRGAIEQANASPGSDTIEFSVAGRISPRASLGPLPRITDTLIIDGSTAPGAPGRDSDTVASPTVIIDGQNLNDVDLDSGLRLHPGAGLSQLINLAVVNFPRDGVFVITDGPSWITGCWLGVDPATGRAAGNRHGLALGSGTSGIIVGRTLPADGRGNVLSGNRMSGLRSEASLSLFRGNRIGVNAAGFGEIPNLLGGADFPFGAGNEIGLITDVDSERNIIAGNQFYNLSVTGDGHLIRGNFVGCGLNDPLGNSGTGIRAFGNDITVGGAEDSGNVICAHAGPGVLASGADDLAITHNVLSDNGSGITVDNSSRLSVADNTISESAGAGIALSDLTGANLARNSISGSDTGIIFNGATDSQIDTNLVFQNDRGIRLEAASDNHVITGNEITLSTLDGIDITASSGNHVFGNLIAGHGGAGVVLSAEPSLGNTISSNRIYSNAGLGIDLGGDGPNLNDPGDPDLGPNALQNSPTISLTRFAPGLKGGAPGPEVELSYLVDSSVGDSAYPLTVEFFLSAADTPDQGEEFLVALNYNNPQNPVDVAIGLPPGTVSGRIVATATDADGNTSEFSVPVALGRPEIVFSDGFESP